MNIASASAQYLNKLMTSLEDSGRRITPQRARVVQVLVTHGGHPTPIEIRDSVWQSDSSISQATVYNTFVDVGGTRFDPKT